MTAVLDLADDVFKKVEELAAAHGKTVAAFVSDTLASAVAAEEIQATGDNFPSEETAEELAERMRKWNEDEDAFLKLMSGPDLDPRSAAEIISEGRNRCG